MNFILIKHGYLPAVIHSIERQRYYEVLRFENDRLMNLVVESLENSIETTAKFLDELTACASSAPAEKRRDRRQFLSDRRSQSERNMPFCDRRHGVVG